MSDPKLGREMRLYYDSSGAGVGTWTEVNIATEAKFDLMKTMADIAARLTTWKKKKGTTKEMKIDFTMLLDEDDGALDAMYDSFLDGTIIGLAICNGSITENGVKGIKADFEVSNINDGEPLDGQATLNVTAELRLGGADPERFTVGAGSGS
jgi:hypothetical protein